MRYWVTYRGITAAERRTCIRKLVIFGVLSLGLGVLARTSHSRPLVLFAGLTVTLFLDSLSMLTHGVYEGTSRQGPKAPSAPFHPSFTPFPRIIVPSAWDYVTPKSHPFFQIAFVLLGLAILVKAALGVFGLWKSLTG